MKGFIDFIRKQGVVGLAVGFVMGGSIKELITALVDDIINPIVGFLIGSVGNLDNVYLRIGSTKILFGSFISSLIDFLIIAFVVYFSVKILGVEKLDKKKKK
ncbi:MAG: MscL family protein [Candidatus Shapirobacteria bacterium]|nr:MscL family protein [Candidatus Shapirobacteria bacterium]